MRFLFSLAILSAGLIYAQAPAQQPSKAEVEQMKAAAQAAVKAKPAASGEKPAAPPAVVTRQVDVGAQLNFMSMPASKVVATVDGDEITAGTLRAIVSSVPPQMQQQAIRNPRLLLEQYGLMSRLAKEAVEAKLDQQSPVKESLEAVRKQILAQAGMGHHLDGISVSEDELKAQYEASKDNFMQARVKAIYLPFGEPSPQADANAPKPMTEAEAKAKAEELVKQARSGADFVKLVKENSKDPNSVAKDGDFGMIARNSSIPEAAKKAIFETKAGEVTDPVRMPNGFYVFRIEELVTPPLEQVRAQVLEQAKNAKFGAWLREQQSDIKIVELSSPAAQQQQPAAPAVK